MEKTSTTPEGLFIDDGGARGTPVLFVHSAAGSTEHWAAQLAHLRERGRRALAVDLRGHGRSRLPADRVYSIAALADDVGAAADFARLDRFVLVGHSMGGAVAVEFAGRHPERVAGLLLLDPAADGRGLPDPDGLMKALEADRYRDTMEQYWSPMLEASPVVRDRVFAGLWRTPREVVVEPLRALLTFDPVTPLSRYHGPRLSIITRFNEAPIAYHALVPDLPHRKLDGTGHWLHMDAPDQVNRQIDDFLDQVEAQPSSSAG